MLNLGTIRLVPAITTFLAAAAALPLAGCFSPPDIDAPELAAAPQTEAEAARARAVQEMRLSAEVAEGRGYPDVFAAPAVAAPAPLPMNEVAATEADLLQTARQRSAQASAGDLAAGEARALELRRLALLRQQQAEQAIRASGAPQ